MNLPILGRHSTKLFVFFNCLFITFGIIVIAFGIATSSKLMKDQFFTEAHRSLNMSVKTYWTNLCYQMEFDNLQKTFHCCGADSSNDYSHVKQLIPTSCLSGIKPYSLGCADALNILVQYYKTILIYLCFSFGIIHGVYLLFSFLMICISKIGKIGSSQTCCSDQTKTTDED